MVELYVPGSNVDELRLDRAEDDDVNTLPADNVIHVNAAINSDVARRRRDGLIEVCNKEVRVSEREEKQRTRFSFLAGQSGG